MLLERARNATQESKVLDFKGEFETDTAGWCKVVKDIIAMANSGGGVLVFGLKSDGSPSGSDCSELLQCDVTKITDQVYKYTQHDFAELEVAQIQRGEFHYPALLIGDAEIPIPFTKGGYWEIAATAETKQQKKVEFAEGTVYFRRGAKSAPATRADLMASMARYASAERKRLIGGMRKVISAPVGSVVTVGAPTKTFSIAPEGVNVRISNDPDAMRIIPRRTADFYPHRGKELMTQVNASLQDKKISYHDVVCINRMHKVFDHHPEFATKPHANASPQYSNAYAGWIIEKVNTDPEFISNARAEYARQQREKGYNVRKPKKKILAPKVPDDDLDP